MKLSSSITWSTGLLLSLAMVTGTLQVQATPKEEMKEDALAVQGFASEPVTPLPRAHAHNDYAHRRPLLDALENGFCSVEADIFLVDGQLLVAHDFRDVRADRTLESLYLAPLQERVKQNRGHVYSEAARFWLLIDIKSQAVSTYEVLRKELEKYRDMLTLYGPEGEQPRAVTVVISGNRPRELMAGERVRYAAVDGRISDLDSAAPETLLPWISDNWNLHFRWRGNGEMPETERTKLRDLVQKAHEQKRRVRFWATPDQPAVWRELLDSNVDFINTDDLPGLRTFLLPQ